MAIRRGRRYKVGAFGSCRRTLRCLLLGATLLVCAGCALPWDGSGPSVTRTPTAPPSSSLSALHPGRPDLGSPPQGWRRILDGQRFSSDIGDRAPGLVASYARPGRLAGCALPAGSLDKVAPVFVLSDDGGLTWRAFPIPGAPAADTCVVLADTQQADTFLVSILPPSSNGVALFTVDAGVTWHKLAVPPGPDTQVWPYYSLVAGHLLAATMTPQGGVYWHLRETLLSGNGNSPWRQLDSNLPNLHFAQYPGYLNEPQAIATAPDDPARIYLITGSDAGAMEVYATSNAGQSWRLLYRLPTAKRVKLWTATDHRVYVQDLDDRNSPPHQFFYSLDAGAHWLGIGLHARMGEDIFISPGGRIVTRVTLNATEDNLFTLDPATGTFALLGERVPLGPGVYLGVVVDGPAPAFIYCTVERTYAFPLR